MKVNGKVAGPWAWRRKSRAEQSAGMAGRDSASFFPDPEQAILLEALLQPEEQARTAALAWLDRADLDALEPASLRLLPLLHKRLAELGVSHPLTDRLREAHRRAWLADKKLRLQLAAVHRQLAEAGVPVILLKGLSLGLHAYPIGGTRPTHDLDLLVPQDLVDCARETVEANDWRYRPCHALHARTFVNGSDLELDLHISPYREAVSPRHVAGLWQRRRTIASGNAVYSVLSVEDELLHTMGHGMYVSPISPIRWIVDAVMLLRAGHDIDWEVLIREAAALELSHVAWRGLTYLGEAFGVEIPAHVRERLRRAASKIEQMEYRFNRHNRLWSPLETWMRLRRSEGSRRERAHVFVNRYKRAWSTDSTSGFAYRVARRMVLGKKASL